MKTIIRYIIGIACYCAWLIGLVSLCDFLVAISASQLFDALLMFAFGMLALSTIPVAARLIVGKNKSKR